MNEKESAPAQPSGNEAIDHAANVAIRRFFTASRHFEPNVSMTVQHPSGQLFRAESLGGGDATIRPVTKEGEVGEASTISTRPTIDIEM